MSIIYVASPFVVMGFLGYWHWVGSDMSFIRVASLLRQASLYYCIALTTLFLFLKSGDFCHPSKAEAETSAI